MNGALQRRIRRVLLDRYGIRIVRVKEVRRGGITDEELLCRMRNSMETKRLYLDRNYSIVKLATEIGSNRSYVTRALSSQGMTFHDFVNSFRIGYAIELLGEPRNAALSVEEIALSCGFASERTMNYYLRRNMGLTISSLRRLVTKKRMAGEPVILSDIMLKSV